MPESPNRTPKHVAVIMDGNGRWAQRQNLPRHSGHRAGVQSVREVVEVSAQRGVEILTIFAFSSENWKRPKTEVSLLMELFMTALGREVRRLKKNNVRLEVIGDRSAFPNRLQKRIAEAEAATADNTGLRLVVAANYGGRWDIANAARQLAQKVAQGELAADAIDETLFGQYVCMADYPEPDFFIRTSGELRVSNYLLWQLAYTEFYFTDTLWPDFRTEAYSKALDEFANRQRRFGLTGEQTTDKKNDGD